MNCPHCEKDTKGSVIETRGHASGTYRRRSCGHCGKSFVTHEVTSKDLKMPAELGNLARKKRRAAQTLKGDFSNRTRKKSDSSAGADLQRIW